MGINLHIRTGTASAPKEAPFQDFNSYHKKLGERQQNALSTIMNFSAARQAESILSDYAEKSGNALYRGVVEGARGNISEADACASKCSSLYMKGMIAISCGNERLPLAEMYLATMAKFLDENGADGITWEMKNGAGNYSKPEGKIDGKTINTLIRKGMTLSSFFNSFRPDIAMEWAGLVKMYGYPENAGILAADCKMPLFAQNCANETIREFEEAKMSDYGGAARRAELLMHAGVIFAKIGNPDLAVKLATEISGSPELYGCVAACIKDYRWQAEGWEIGMTLLEKEEHLDYAFKIFLALGDPLRAAKAAVQMAEKPVEFPESGLLLSALLCKKKIAQLKQEFDKISNEDYESIAFDALAGNTPELATTLIRADRDRYSKSTRKFC
jgi:hypothetical protein